VTLAQADLVGIVGGALMVFGYAYSNVATRLNYVLFNAVNLVGSVLLILSLSVAFNLASMLLEIVWGLIAAAGLAKALLAQRSA
jgi:hypothetical protein